MAERVIKCGDDRYINSTSETTERCMVQFNNRIERKKERGRNGSGI